jgi:hypothetical protein
MLWVVEVGSGDGSEPGGGAMEAETVVGSVSRRFQPGPDTATGSDGQLTARSRTEFRTIRKQERVHRQFERP